MTEALTCGVHHVGLAVPDLEAAVGFFRDALGWKVVARNESYPSAFISDGAIMLTLWQVEDPATATAFDRRANIGLHHIALAVADEPALHKVFGTVSENPKVTIEFAPQPISTGSETKHFICAMPGGLRIEFAVRS
jgi:catechol 2,3-dioxygenase-like lactoylglutathione lyase family enzyme